MVAKSKAALVIAAALGAIVWFTRRAVAAPATPSPIGDATFGPLGYPDGTAPYHDSPNDAPGVLPQAKPVSLPPYPPGGFTQDIRDTSPYSWAWARQKYGGATVTPNIDTTRFLGNGLVF